MQATPEQLELDLPSSIARGELCAHFQPQIDLATGRVVAVEALCRWKHPEFGMIQPAMFIALAEATGFIHELGQFMVDEAFSAAAHWTALGFPIEISVNVSPLQLADSEFSDLLGDDLRTYDLPAESMTIEITESLPVTHLSDVVHRLSILRNLGLGVSLDDFGVGHSSRDQLDSLPASELKIDRSLVQDATMFAFIDEIVALAHERGVRVVAEGIETEEHLQRVRDLNCDRAQGYLLGMPMDRDDLDALLLAA